MNTSARVYIVLVNWNGWRDTIECLESVLRGDYPNYRVIVCDNGSWDGSLERIRDWTGGRLEAVAPADNPLRRLSSPPVKKPVKVAEYDRAQAESGGSPNDTDAKVILIRTGANLGFAGGNNVGLRYALARGDLGCAWLLNNDTVVEPDALSRLVERMEAKPGAGICGSTLLCYEQPETVMAYGGATFNKWLGVSRHIGWMQPLSPSINAEQVEQTMGHVAGASMLVSRDFLENVGLLEESYFLYFEELDWAMRARGRYCLAYAPGSVVYHKQGESTGSGKSFTKTNPAADRYLIGNRLVFTRRFFPWALPSVYFGLSVTILNRMRRRQWTGLGSILATILKGRPGGNNK